VDNVNSTFVQCSFLGRWSRLLVSYFWHSVYIIYLISCADQPPPPAPSTNLFWPVTTDDFIYDSVGSHRSHMHIKNFR